MAVKDISKVLGVGAVIAIVMMVALMVRSNQETNRLRQKINELEQQTETTEQPRSEEAKQLVAKVSELIILPEGEDPTVATITDRERLSEVSFFAQAENGDVALIFTQARKAFLYRPSAHKIVEVATLSVNTASPNPAISPRISPSE